MIDIRVELKPNQPWEAALICHVYPVKIKKLVDEIKRKAGPQAAGITIDWAKDGLHGTIMRRGLDAGTVEVRSLQL